MKKLLIILFLLATVIVLSCNNTFLKPAEEISDLEYTKYYINLDYSPQGGSQFDCQDILYSVENSGGDMLCIRGIVNSDSINSIANCLEKNKLLVYLDLRYSTYYEPISNKAWYTYFRDKTNITAIYFPSDTREIYWYAFENCSNLEMIAIPDTLGRMRPDMFGNCTNLKTVVYFGKNISFTGGDKPGEAWRNIPSGQITLYLPNIDRDSASGNMSTTVQYGSWPKWGGYTWKEVKFKGEFDLKAIVR
ncbi:leucine-rich repeat protein [Brachyspira alvinipulli]|uniref:leucine-rich repeat protein n=1 Tax=Brachyspira alvinipulli TaxID=84379 RepID=UPI0004891B0F|nr:leucine-rich repeat protein [Brachyspira alvinipulli]